MECKDMAALAGSRKAPVITGKLGDEGDALRRPRAHTAAASVSRDRRPAWSRTVRSCSVAEATSLKRTTVAATSRRASGDWDPLPLPPPGPAPLAVAWR